MRSLVPAVLVLAFTVYCVLDVLRSADADVRGLPKPLWVLLVLLLPIAGGVGWLVAGRPRSSRPPGAAPTGTPRRPVLGPDDDADFLRSIDRPRPVPPAGPLGPGKTGNTDRTAPSGADAGDADGAEHLDPPAEEQQHDDETGPGAGADDRRP